MAAKDAKAFAERCAAVTAERDALLKRSTPDAKGPLLTPVTTAAPSAAAPPPPAAAATDEPGKLLEELPGELSLLSPRGKFKLALHENAAAPG